MPPSFIPFLMLLYFSVEGLLHFYPTPQKKKVAFKKDREGEVEVKETFHAEIEQHQKRNE